MFEYILALFIIFIIWNLVKKPSQYPPGPWGIPLFGYIPFGLKHFHEKISELQEKHHPLFSWRIGSQLFVFITDYKLVKEAFQSQTFANRPKPSFVNVFEDTDLGITTSNGIHWHNIRKFTLRHLRDLGLGKSKTASVVQREANELVRVMKKNAGTVGPVPEETSAAIINILWQMVAGKRHELNDAEIISLHNDMTAFQTNFDLLIIRDFFPWLDSVLPESVMNFITKKHIRKELERKIANRFEKDIDEHISSLNETDPRDLIDEYLIEMEKQKNDPDSTMSRRDLLGCVADLFGAGLETTSITLHWSIYYLAKYLEIQKELQSEIDAALPNGNSPTMEDKSKLPKMEAFINEILRCTSLVEFGVPRTVTNDTKFAGYVIPKGAVVMAGEKIIHYNKNVYDFPERFNPNRFIDSNGKFENQKEGFIPFGIGKRQCLGESLARMELFIFLVTMLQQVEFHPPPNSEINLNPINIPIFCVPHREQNILIKARS